MTEILDLIVIFLLILAIVYGILLNRKINLIQDSKKELANLFKSFDNTILKAQSGIDNLNNASNDASNNLQQRINKASVMIDDLSFLSEKAAEITAALDKKISNTNKAIAVAKAAPKEELSGELTPEMVKRMRQQRLTSQPKETLADSNDRDKKALMLEGLLEKISEGKASAPKETPQPRTPQAPAKNTAAKSLRDPEDVAEVLKSLGFGEN